MQVESAAADLTGQPLTAPGPDPAPSALDACEAHRDELAARLCAGLRVAVLGAPDEERLIATVARSAAAITCIDPNPRAAESGRAVRRDENMPREAIDIPELLAADLGTRFDALLILDPSVIEQDLAGRAEDLTRLAAGGMKLLVCARNALLAGELSQPAGDRGGLPLASLEELPGAVTLKQFAAEGSLIRSDEGAELDAALALPEHGEGEYANYLIVCVNFDAAQLDEARLELRVAPQYNRQLRNLERANRELREANAALARGWLGKRDTASASMLGRLREAEAERDAAIGSLSWKITAPLRAFKAIVKPFVRVRRQRRREAARRI